MDPITVVINMPFDWVGSVAVPVAAILVSSLIAVGLTRAERKAAQQDRTRAELGNLSRSLIAMTKAANDEDADAWNVAHARVGADLNVLAFHLPTRDHAVLKFTTGAIADAMPNGFAALSTTAQWVANCIEAWSRGQISTAEFAKATPESADPYWDSSPNLADYAKKTGVQPQDPASQS